MTMNKFIERWGPFMKARSKEASTWRGLFMVISAAGIAMSPDQITMFAALGMGVSGFIGALTKDDHH